MEDILRTCYELPFQAHREINKSRCYIANIGMVKAAVIQKTFPNPRSYKLFSQFSVWGILTLTLQPDLYITSCACEVQSIY
jgi:hypothetical protein